MTWPHGSTAWKRATGLPYISIIWKMQIPWYAGPAQDHCLNCLTKNKNQKKTTKQTKTTLFSHNSEGQKFEIKGSGGLVLCEHKNGGPMPSLSP